ncbi:ATP synthase F1 subunit gamma [Mesomycoplasma lagogenitalium]|uniref:ATP synthase gamma chain n=1 Tax=Mesomycoplasma lagogenitalium TaxID=171286 RepID=A0ABY8LXA7_9BACT|nr:ATP synthase F1 subunit gamma [Mesomycoplasma lagogenitalium]WGI37051.1 ATP synthase F1 subunit gamma [Mesomycoplasma lagogenitalium]
MASLQKIKTRINLIENTRKITKAMELLSSAKLRKMKNNHLSIQEYVQTINDILASLFQNSKDAKNVIKLDNNKGKLYIIITSDLGLCGGYNTNIFKLVKNQLKDEDKIIIFGNKGFILFKDYEQQIIQSHLNYGDDLNYVVVSKVLSLIEKMIDNKEISAINVVYTKFINSVTYEPINFQLLPINYENFANKSVKNNTLKALTEFEPSASVIVKNIVPLYLGSSIFSFLAESKISEMSSRRSAMENASNNADEIISNLEIVFNRGRQSSITQEITEIIGGTSSE